MQTKFPLASTASLIADPARAAMLTLLLDGCQYSAGELARTASVSAQSASMHLAQLLEGGFVLVSQEGRHRYYRIASAVVAQAIEALGVISTPVKSGASRKPDALRYARTCYDHLAGELAVRLAEALGSKGALVSGSGREYELTGRGEEFFAKWQIDVKKLRRTRRIFALRCVDWTERRDHVAGALGAAMFQKLLEFRWITRGRGSRMVRVTLAGRRELTPLLDASHAAQTFHRSRGTTFAAVSLGRKS
jgi:DNA-binding transcriptional ArsR family regulator